jgi:hypothetical protein
MLEKAEMKRGDEEMEEKSGAAGKCRLGTNVGKVGRWQGWKASTSDGGRYLVEEKR